uniref:Uncharacterized protein n=1 Tax=Wuchereria bancrofti TaxID=6293 RepID=A0A1I8ERK7_WUCBA
MLLRQKYFDHQKLPYVQQIWMKNCKKSLKRKIKIQFRLQGKR